MNSSGKSKKWARYQDYPKEERGGKKFTTGHAGG